MNINEMARINRVKNVDYFINVALARRIDEDIEKSQNNEQKERKEKLEKRKAQIAKILENYEQNNDVILQRDRYKTNEQKNNEVKGKDEVDRDLQQIIIEEMRKLYEECSEMYIKIQILDRGIFIRDLLENFDSNIEYMKQRNKEVEFIFLLLFMCIINICFFSLFA